MSSAADSCFLCCATWKRTRWCPPLLLPPFSTVLRAEAAPLTIWSVFVVGCSPSVVGVFVCLLSINDGFNNNFRWFGTEKSSSLDCFAAAALANKIYCCWDFRIDLTWKRFGFLVGFWFIGLEFVDIGDEHADSDGKLFPFCSRLSNGW